MIRKKIAIFLDFFLIFGNNRKYKDHNGNLTVYLQKWHYSHYINFIKNVKDCQGKVEKKKIFLLFLQA